MVANMQGCPRTSVFIPNFIAIIPLATLLSYAIEEIRLHCGDILCGLLMLVLGEFSFSFLSPFDQGIASWV